MKRKEVLDKLYAAAKEAGLDYEEIEGGPHTKIKVGGKKSTIGRHTEIDDIAAKKFYKQFEEVLGEGWWK